MPFAEEYCFQLFCLSGGSLSLPATSSLSFLANFSQANIMIGLFVDPRRNFLVL